MDRIYLDYAATTPLDAEVLNAMIPVYRENFGNPSSSHFFGQAAEGAVEQARSGIAKLLNAKNFDILFTSGGSESDNLALRGTAMAERRKRGANRILVSAVEHPAILATAKQLRDEFGFEFEILRVDKFGQVILEELEKNLTESVAIVSVIHGNNEIGTVNPIPEIAEICHSKGVLLHTDAVQAAAHLDLDLEQLGADLVSIGAHKFYGPKGVGALIKRKEIKPLPQISGGKQEGGIRAGTHNVPGIVGMTVALRRQTEFRAAEYQNIVQLRDRLIEGVLQSVSGSTLTGHPTKRLANHASFVFEGINGNELLINLDMAGFAVSSGSACKVGNPSPSEVLLALGIDSNLALGSLRVTLGRFSTQEHADRFLEVLPGMVTRLRG